MYTLTIDRSASYAAHVKCHHILCQCSSLPKACHFTTLDINQLYSSAPCQRKCTVSVQVLHLMLLFLLLLGCLSPCGTFLGPSLSSNSIPDGLSQRYKTNYITRLQDSSHCTDRDLTYSEIGTNVFITIMYEKNWRVEMISGLSNPSSHGAYH